LPSLYRLPGGYRIFFWSNENEEPVHVHVCKGNPSENATKIWLTSAGACLLAHNASRISKRDLHKIQEFISAQFADICNSWKVHFQAKSLQYYC